MNLTSPHLNRDVDERRRSKTGNTQHWFLMIQRTVLVCKTEIDIR